MGRHDKKVEMIWDETVAESYTAAENRRLRSENERLKTRIKALEREAARMEKVYGGVVEGSRRAIGKWKAENAALKAKIAKRDAAEEERLKAMGRMAEEIYV